MSNGEEPPGAIAEQGVVRPDSHAHAHVNRTPARDAVLTNRNISSPPAATRKGNPEIIQASHPFSTSGNISDNVCGPVANPARRDYEWHLELLAEQNRRRLQMERQVMESHDDMPNLGLQLMTSRPDQLNNGHNAVDGVVQIEPPFPSIIWLPSQLTKAHKTIKKAQQDRPSHLLIQDSKNAIAVLVTDLKKKEEEIEKKAAEVRSLEGTYDSLVAMTPQALQGEQLQLKEKALAPMKAELRDLRSERDECSGRVEEEKKKMAYLEDSVEKIREVVPVLIEDLRRLVDGLGA